MESEGDQIDDDPRDYTYNRDYTYDSYDIWDVNYDDEYDDNKSGGHDHVALNNKFGASGKILWSRCPFPNFPSFNLLQMDLILSSN